MGRSRWVAGAFAAAGVCGVVAVVLLVVRLTVSESLGAPLAILFAGEALVFAAVAGVQWWYERGLPPPAHPAQLQLPGAAPVTKMDMVHLDYVDDQTLNGLAEVLEVDARTERAAHEKHANAEINAQIVKVGVGASSETEREPRQRELIRAVIEALIDEEQLLTDLAMIPSAAAREGVEVDAGGTLRLAAERLGVEGEPIVALDEQKQSEITDELVRVTSELKLETVVRQRLEAVSDAEYVLIANAQWHVRLDGEACAYELAQLTPPPDSELPPRPPPSGTAVTAEVAAASLSATARARYGNGPCHIGMLGRVQSSGGGRVKIAPTAIFWPTQPMAN